LQFCQDHPAVFEAQLHLINIKWQMGQFAEAKHLYHECLNQNASSAKQIFEINPKLLDDTDFLYLAD
jgi:hypothetical protein